GRLLDEVGLARATRAFPAGLDLIPVSKRPTVLPGETVVGIRALRGAAGADSLPPAPTLSVVVTAVDGVDFTRICLETLLSGALGEVPEVIVVDNASRDETRSYLRALSRRDRRVTVIRNRWNRGFPAAVNQGLEVARAERLVVLNNDT